MTNTELLEKQDLREQLIERIDVLSKVKALFLVPKLEVLTVKQVAEYFEVPVETIKSCYKYNQNEIDNDGVSMKTFKDFLKVELQPLVKTQGKTVFQVSDGVTLEVPNRGLLMFPQRAVLRIAMLLRDSEVAKEVRTQLLNTFEQAAPEQRTADIDEETKLMLNIGKATMSGDIKEITMAYTNAFAFKNRHITQLEKSNTELSQNNKALADGILEWSDRSSVNSAVRLLAVKSNTPFACIWSELYKELQYKYHIGLSMRGSQPYIQHIKESEWKYVVQVLSAMCESRGLSPSRILAKSKLVKGE